MLSLFALLAQAASPPVALPVDARLAAQTCAVASVATRGTRAVTMTTSSEFTYYLMHAANAAPADKPFVLRLQEATQATLARASNEASRSPALLPLCAARFAPPRPPVASRLPTDAFRRDMMCAGVLGLVQGLAEAMAEKGQSAPIVALDAAIADVSDRLGDDALRRNGVDSDDKFNAMLGEQVQASLAVGEPLAVATACGAKGL